MCHELGLGVCEQINGFQTHRAICILRAITGNFDVKGGDVWLPLPSYFSKYYEFSQLDNIPPEVKGIGADKFPVFVEIFKNSMPCTFGAMHMACVPEAIQTETPYPIKAYIISGANVVITTPNQKEWEDALKKLDFIVVIDLFMSQTAKLADIVLPAAWWLEKTDLSEQWPYIGYTLLRQKIEPPPECRPEEEIIFELAGRMGLKKYFPWKNVEEVIDDLFSPTVTMEKLKKNPGGIWIEGKWPESIKYKKYESEGFNTLSGKIELYSEDLAKAGYDPLPCYYEYINFESKEAKLSVSEIEKKYPLFLSKHNTLVYAHSQLRNIPILRGIEQEPSVEIHPETAKKFGITDGDEVLIESPRAVIKAKAKTTERAHPEVIFMIHGWEESNTNALYSGKIQEGFTGVPATRECRVNVRKC